MGKPPIDSDALMDRYFLEHRAKLIDVAAFLDRIERAGDGGGYRAHAFRAAILELSKAGADRAQRVLLAFTDPSSEPEDHAETQGATGAHNPQ